MDFLQTIVVGASLGTSCIALALDSLPCQSPFGLKLEQSTLSDVRAKFGEADEFDIPDSHHEFGICYQAEDSEEIAIFISGHEFGGPENLLLGVTIRAQNTQSFPCAASELVSSELRIGEMVIGLTPEQFQSLAATEAESSDQGELFHDLEYRRPLTSQETERFGRMFPDGDGPDGVDVGLGIWCSIVDGRAKEVGVWQISTY